MQSHCVPPKPIPGSAKQNVNKTIHYCTVINKSSLHITRVFLLPHRRRPHDPIFIRLNRVPACDRRMDRQTELPWQIQCSALQAMRPRCKKHVATTEIVNCSSLIAACLDVYVLHDNDSWTDIRLVHRRCQCDACQFLHKLSQLMCHTIHTATNQHTTVDPILTTAHISVQLHSKVTRWLITTVSLQATKSFFLFTIASTNRLYEITFTESAGVQTCIH